MHRRAKHPFSWCLVLVALASLGSGAARSSAFDARSFGVELGEADLLFVRLGAPVPSSDRELPEWAKAPEDDTDRLTLLSHVRSGDGQKPYDLAAPPYRTAYWKYPIYAALGLPRDLIDGFFGAVGQVPLLNLPLTGLLYEVAPTQFFCRHWRDCHQWPGRTNAKGHGWIDSPEGWGFFSNSRETVFRRVDTEELERRRQFNQTFENRHAQANSEIDALNDFARAQRASYFEETEKLYRQGEYRKAIPRLMANTQGDPRHRLARALLVAALVAELPRLETPDWAREEIAWQIRRESKQTLALMKEELTAFAQKPECEVDATLYLAWIALRLGNGEEGGALAKRLTERDPDRGFYWRVRFEAALIAARESEVSEALAGVERTLGPDAVETLHARGRAALIRGDFGQAVAIYANLAKAQSGRARFHYLLATALVEQGEASGRVEKMRAMRHFRKAIDLAVEPAERTVYEMAWRAAQTRLQPVVYRTE